MGGANAIAATKRVVGHGGNPPGQGPFMRVALEVADGVIQHAAYETYQCPACHDCGKALCAMVTGRSVADAEAIDHAALAARVGPLPRAKAICYSLAVLALADALAQLAREGE
jgi:NifU-like protein involved in Fe-S cluster formation